MTSENQEPNQQKPSEPAKDENSEIFSLDNIDDSWLDETDVFTRDKDGQVKRKPKPQPKPGGAPPPPVPGQNANVPSKPAAPPPPPMAAHRIASTSHDRAAKPVQPARPPQPAQPPPPPQPAQSARPPQPAQSARPPQPAQPASPPQPTQPAQQTPPLQPVKPAPPPQPAQPAQQAPLPQQTRPPQPVQPAQPVQSAQPAPQPTQPVDLSPKEKGKITGEINLPPGVPQSRVTPPSIKEANNKPASSTGGVDSPAVAKKQEIFDQRTGYHYWVEKSDHMKVHGQYLPFGSRSKTNEEVLEAEANAASAASVGAQTAVADAPPLQPPEMVQAPELPDALAAIAAPSALSPGEQDQSTSNYMSDLLSGVNQVIDEKSIPPELKDSTPLTAESEKPNVQGFDSPVVEAPVSFSPAESPVEDKEKEPSTETETKEREQIPEQEVEPVADLYSRTQSEVDKPVVRGPETRAAEQAPEGDPQSVQEEPQAVPTEPSPSRVPHINQGSQMPLAAIVAGLVVVGIIVGIGLYQLKEFTSQKPKEQTTTKLNSQDGSTSGDTVNKTTKEPERTTPMERWEKDFEKGQKFFSDKQYDSAVIYFSTAISENPKKFEILHLRGKAYAKQKDYEHAIQDYTKALKLSKNNELVLLDRAAAYVYTDNLRRALRDYSRLLRINPENSKASYGRALVRVKQKSYSAALKDFQNTVDSDPNYSNAYLQMGRIYAADDKNEEAIEAFTKAVRIRKTPELYYERSLAKYHQGQYQSAIDDLTAAIGMERDNKEYYNDRGYIFLKLGRKVEAREDFSKALKIDPSYDLAKQNMKKLENSF